MAGSYLPNQIAVTQDFAPGYGVVLDPQPGQVARDESGALYSRGQILTDEGGYRANFANSSLASSIGTATFTNGSTTVAWTYADTYDIHTGDKVFLDADTITNGKTIAAIYTDSIELDDAYTGTGGTGASSRQVLTSKVGAGGTITVANGTAIINAGTTAGSVFELERDVDYLPLKKMSGITISQRIANQTIYLGYYNELYTPTNTFARFEFTGTDATVVNCVTGRNPTQAPSASEQESFTVKIPNGGTTAVSNRYEVTIQKNKVSFWINGIRVAQCFRVCPRAHDVLTSTIQVVNGTTPATSTVVTVGYDACINENSISIDYFSQDTEAQAPNVPMTNYPFSQAGIIAINTDLILIDCTQFRTLIIQCTSMGASGVCTPYFSSDDGTTYVAGSMSTQAGAVATTFNAAGSWVIPVTGRLFRLRLTTATTSGTTTIRVQGMHQNGLQPVSVLGTVPVSFTQAALPASTNLIGDVGIQYRANATGQASIHHKIAAGSTNATNVKASAGRVVGWSAINTTASFRYIKLHNTAGTPTAGSGVVLTIAIPPNSVNNMPLGGGGLGFATGIAYTMVTGVADADTAAVTASDIVFDLFWL